MEPSHKDLIILSTKEALNMLIDLGAVSYTADPVFRKQAYAYLRKRSIDRSRFRQTLQYLIERGYVRDAVKGKERYLEVTSPGRARANVEPPLVLKTPKRWDRRWRIVLFDIPARYTKTRNYFREHLKGWGFLPLQRSIYVYPFDCHTEVTELINRFKLKGMVQYLIAEIIEGEEAIMNTFLNNQILTKGHFTQKKKQLVKTM